MNYRQKIDAARMKLLWTIFETYSDIDKIPAIMVETFNTLTTIIETIDQGVNYMCLDGWWEYQEGVGGWKQMESMIIRSFRSRVEGLR